MIRGVFFDLDNTLYSFDRAHEAGLRSLGEYCGRKLGMSAEETEGSYHKAMEAYCQRLGMDNAAIHNRLLRFQYMLEQRRVYSPGAALEMYESYYGAFLEAMVPEPGIYRLLGALRDRGVLIGIGTDMTTLMQFIKLKKLDMLPLVDVTVTSEDAGAEKPHPKFFQFCADRAGCWPEEMVFIGDHLTKDVQGSIHSGMYGIHYCPAGEPGKGCPHIGSYRDCCEGEKVRLGEKLI